ncbi:hypothetical protein Desaf_3401 [Desulfocurvibacter africanus subsp. africanus str. Walvis Bay]|uniref:Uncharacterized protein n=1 Tax=Desulfocurvibacter africanus subsp. africanus str. Walvis Bay TaxID=690850 RepID=F3YWW3_DESAF|nr:hypothetical protein Desaf_3401 [Desulfocurvibacter africanus subsp. africanus str. Walvis Bay]
MLIEKSFFPKPSQITLNIICRNLNSIFIFTDKLNGDILIHVIKKVFLAYDSRKCLTHTSFPVSIDQLFFQDDFQYMTISIICIQRRNALIIRMLYRNHMDYRFTLLVRL